VEAALAGIQDFVPLERLLRQVEPTRDGEFAVTAGVRRTRDDPAEEGKRRDAHARIQRLSTENPSLPVRRPTGKRVLLRQPLPRLDHASPRSRAPFRLESGLLEDRHERHKH